MPIKSSFYSDMPIATSLLKRSGTYMLSPGGGGGGRRSPVRFSSEDHRKLFNFVAPRIGCYFDGSPLKHRFDADQGGSIINPSRLSEFLRERFAHLRCGNVVEYIHVAMKDAGELDLLLDQFTVKETWFFRAPEQLATMRALFPILSEIGSSRRSLKIWSAACSTGEEPYSLAMLFADEPLFRKWNIRIIASDISASALEAAGRAEFGERSRRKMGESRFLPLLEKYSTMNGETIEIDQKIKGMVSFVKHNLLEAPFEEGFDIILCRNAIMYFSVGNQTKALMNLLAASRGNALILLGAEQVTRVHDPVYDRLNCIFGDKSYIYQKID